MTAGKNVKPFSPAAITIVLAAPVAAMAARRLIDACIVFVELSSTAVVIRNQSESVVISYRRLDLRERE